MTLRICRASSGKCCLDTPDGRFSALGRIRPLQLEVFFIPWQTHFLRQYHSLTKDVFRLYYTSLSTDRQTIDVYVEDNFGKMQQLTFCFNNEKAENKEKSVAVVTKALNDANG